MTVPQIARPHPVIMTPDEMRERERLLRGRYFLVRQGTLGEIMKCKRCGGKHAYLTLACIERPFSGITAGVYAYYRTQPALGMTGRSQLSHAEQERLAAMDRIFGKRPDLATSHSEMARKLNQEDGAGKEGDLNLGGVALGVLEPISPVKAQQLVDAINTRAQTKVLDITQLDR
jgi:hypothetical protein